ncbi:MAG: aminopeptidase, partial [Pseudomonadota bacterium]
MTRFHRAACALLLLAAWIPAASSNYAITPGVQAALDRISPKSLRGRLSFLSSDLLEGRDTPSPGLAIAAEYIASEFRRIGLEPAGDDGYYQTAPIHRVQP